MEKKNVILLTVVAVATLLVTVIGATFAFFTAQVGTGETMTITSVSGLSITYDDGAEVKVSNIIPGWGVTYDTNRTKTIVVSNNSAYDLEYTINWTAVDNGFDATDRSNLTYAATMSKAWVTPESHSSSQPSTSVQDIADTVAPTAGTQFDKRTVKAGEKVTYVLRMKYADTSSNQNSQGASFTGTLSIDEKNIKVVAS